MRPQAILHFGGFLRALLGFLMLCLFSKLTVYINDNGLSMSLVWLVFILLPAFLKPVSLLITILAWSLLGFLGLPILPYQIAVSPLSEPSLSLVFASIPMSMASSVILYPRQNFTNQPRLLPRLFALLTSGILGIAVSLFWFMIVKSSDLAHSIVPVLVYNGIPLLASLIFGFFLMPNFAVLRKDR